MRKSPLGVDVLTDLERTYYAVIQLKQEVDNGGLHQYFYNPTGSNYASAKEGLIALSEIGLLDLPGQAKELLFPAVPFPLDTEIRREMIPFSQLQIPTADWALRIRDIERQFSAESKLLEEHLHSFARDHGLLSAPARDPGQTASK